MNNKIKFERVEFRDHARDRFLERFQEFSLEAEWRAALPFGGGQRGQAFMLQSPCGAVFCCEPYHRKPGMILVRTILTSEQAMVNIQQRFSPGMTRATATVMEQPKQTKQTPKQPKRQTELEQAQERLSDDEQALVDAKAREWGTHDGKCDAGFPTKPERQARNKILREQGLDVGGYAGVLYRQLYLKYYHAARRAAKQGAA